MTSLYKIVNRINNTININATVINGFHTSTLRQLDQEWRRKKRLTTNPNAFGVLTNLPDYSFVDGRPTPFGVKQLGRIKKQREYWDRINKLVAEVDFAVANHERRTQAIEEEKRNIIENKLKPKGQNYLDDPDTKN